MPSSPVPSPSSLVLGRPLSTRRGHRTTIGYALLAAVTRLQRRFSPLGSTGGGRDDRTHGARPWLDALWSRLADGKADPVDYFDDRLQVLIVVSGNSATP